MFPRGIVPAKPGKRQSSHFRLEQRPLEGSIKYVEERRYERQPDRENKKNLHRSINLIENHESTAEANKRRHESPQVYVFVVRVSHGLDGTLDAKTHARLPRIQLRYLYQNQQSKKMLGVFFQGRRTRMCNISVPRVLEHALHPVRRLAKTSLFINSLAAM